MKIICNKRNKLKSAPIGRVFVVAIRRNDGDDDDDDAHSRSVKAKCVELKRSDSVTNSVSSSPMMMMKNCHVSFGTELKFAQFRA